MKAATFCVIALWVSSASAYDPAHVERLRTTGNCAQEKTARWGCDLSGFKFPEGANLTGANLSGAFLRGAFLVRANLSGANLRGADLSAAFLEHANLSGANLTGANLTNAFLVGANLSGANLEGVIGHFKGRW